MKMKNKKKLKLNKTKKGYNLLYNVNNKIYSKQSLIPKRVLLIIIKVFIFFMINNILFFPKIKNYFSQKTKKYSSYNNTIISNIVISKNNKSSNDNNFKNDYSYLIAEIIYKLKKNEKYRIPKYILLFDYYLNQYCNDINAYLLFEYYLKENINEAYYIINIESDLYKSLVEQKKTKNLILYDPTKKNFYDEIYSYLLNSMIIVNSFVFFDIQTIVNNVSYLKYILITHAIGYFKIKILKDQLINLSRNKRNIIISSPYEYELFKNKFGYREQYMHKAGLPRYERLSSVTKNQSENQCILISFTYREYNNDVYQKSLFKKNLEALLKDSNLITFLENKKVDLIYIQHHYDYKRNRPFNPEDFPYVKYRNQSFLSYYIEQCSLFITDFSTISFDFMFMNKPALFYKIDLEDEMNFEEKEYMNFDKNNVTSFYFGHVFSEQNELINKIKEYVNKNFEIDDDLKKKYESIFYYKYNIIKRVVDIINGIIEKN